MSTFVVHILGKEPESFRGKVRHVASGEELLFTDRRSLLEFLKRMNALRSQTLADEALSEMHRTGESVNPTPSRPSRPAGRSPAGAGERRARNPQRRTR